MKSVVAIATLLCSFIPASSQADSGFQTIFNGKYIVGGRTITIEHDGAIKLPSSLVVAGWSCQITDQNLSDNGSQSYRNVACSNGTSIVKASASCLVAKPDYDVAQFTLTVMIDESRSVSAEFVLTCETSPKKTGKLGAPAPPAPDRDI